MKQIAIINLENISDGDVLKYREAARAIVFNKDNQVALLHATNNHYYKLPGGGIEKGEDKIEALKRECLEEIGCDVEVVKELGMIVEYRKKYNLKQTSYCYIAKQIGEQKKINLTPDEIEEGFETVWLAPEEACRIISQSVPKNYEGPYMVARDSAFLKEALKFGYK